MMFNISKKSLLVASVQLAAVALLVNCAGGKKGRHSGGSGLNSDEQSAEQQEASSVKAFEETVYPLVTQYCSNCHGKAISPLFATDDVKASHDTLIDNAKVNLGNPERSVLYIRLAELEHNCWSQCEDDAPEMLAQLQAWGEKVGAKPEEFDGIKTEAKAFSSLTPEAPTLVIDPLSVIVEAETATLAGAMAVTQAMGVSGGAYVGVANGTVQADAVANAANSTDIATYTFDVKTAGNYRFFARATAPTNADDQLHVSINAAAPVNWTLDPTEDSEFIWNPARNGNTELPAVALPVGPVTVEIRRNEAGAMMDVVALTADPNFTGGAPREKEVRILKYPLPSECNAPGATLEVEVSDFNTEAYKFKYPRLKIGTTPVHVKGIGILVNGHFNPQYATYALIDETVGPDHAAAGLLSQGAMVVLKEEGPEKDTFAFTFEECGVK
ncbi:MAG: hypothetical protein AB7T49_05745 [Oligoflexales bacterium]